MIRLGPWVRALVCAFALTLSACATGPAEIPHGSFSGKLVLVSLQAKTHASTRDARSLWGVYRASSYTTAAGDTITLPRGMVTDLASIPRLVWTIFPPDGPWVRAAVFHDDCYRTHGTFVWYGKGGHTRAEPYDREECDGLLREGMAALNIAPAKRDIIWSAVRVGGGPGWGN